MGGINGGGKFQAYDWREGIRRIQEEADDYYGHQEGYSGAANSCSFSYVGDKSNLTKKELDKFIDERMDRLGNGDGEVIKVGLAGYSIIKTKIEPARYLNFDTRTLLRGVTRPAILVEYKGNYPRKIAEGTQAELKKKADSLLRSCNYSYPYYLITKKESYICSGNVKNVKKTVQQTNEKQLVLPLYDFIYYGWYRS